MPFQEEFTVISVRQGIAREGKKGELIRALPKRQQSPDELGSNLLSDFLPLFFRCALQDVFVL